MIGNCLRISSRAHLINSSLVLKFDTKPDLSSSVPPPADQAQRQIPGFREQLQVGVLPGPKRIELISSESCNTDKSNVKKTRREEKWRLNEPEHQSIQHSNVIK